MSHPMGILVAMARMTSFRFTVVDDAALNATFAVMLALPVSPITSVGER